MGVCGRDWFYCAACQLVRWEIVRATIGLNDSVPLIIMRKISLHLFFDLTKSENYVENLSPNNNCKITYCAL